MYKYSVIALVVVGLAFGWYQSSLKQDNALLAKDQAEFQFTSISKELQKIGEDLDRVEKMMVKYQQTKQEIQYVDRKVTQQVIKYRDAVPNRCQLNGMWVSTYNTSTLSPAQSASRTDDSPRGNAANTDDAVVLQVATSNNRQCIAEKERLRSLQEWVDGLSRGNIPPTG